MNRIDQIETNALATMRREFEDVLTRFHRNACYPEASDTEIKYGVEALLDVVSNNIRHPMFVNRWPARR